MLSDRELDQIIGPILRKRLAGLGLSGFRVESGHDHDGDPAVFIIADFRGTEQEFDAISLLDSIGEIREKLRKRGDPRLPYVRYTIPDLSREVAV